MRSWNLFEKRFQANSVRKALGDEKNSICSARVEGGREQKRNQEKSADRYFISQTNVEAEYQLAKKKKVHAVREWVRSTGSTVLTQSLERRYHYPWRFSPCEIKG